MRVFELAKKLNITSKELLQKLKRMGIKASNHMTSLQEAEAQRALDRFLKRVPQSEGPIEKKTRVLIKRRPAAPPPEPSPVEGPVALPVPPEIPKPVIKPTAEEKPQEPVKIPPGVSPLIPQASTLSKAPPAEAEKEIGEKEKRKLLKTDLFELSKEELSNRYRERFKKGRKVGRLKGDTWAGQRLDLTGWGEGPRPEGFKRGGTKMPVSASTGLAEITKPRKKVIRLLEGLTVKEFAELIGLRAAEVVRKLMEMGSMVTINQPMDRDAAVLIADSCGLKAEIVQEQTEEELLAEEAEEPAELQPRPPVVTIMGHVDHGKTSLLDAIRETKVALGEAGGITQHIGAYSVKVGDRAIVFLDTPGHEAFTAMRARGAKVTDIVVLVVAADDGVMPQTVEAINHARVANVPIIVAINKIDKPDANPERVKHVLSEYNLVSEAWGGQTIFVEVSAKKRINLNTLLEMILLQADVLELKANPNRPARGIVIEAKMSRGRGPVATLLIQNGTLRVGDAFVMGVFSGRIRVLINDEGHEVMEARPAMPVEVTGLPGVPQAGDSAAVFRDERLAREIALARQLKQRTQELAAKMGRPITLKELYAQIQQGTIKELRLILRADVQGSVEALRESLTKLSTSAVKLNIIHAGVGALTETDILLASASNAIVIGFNVRSEPNVMAIADREKVDIRFYTVIYDAINDVKAAMEGLLEPILQERVLGRCEVRQTFSISKAGTIAGTYVTDGMIVRASSGARVIRDGVLVYNGKIGSLKRFKEDVREVQTGYECGVCIENFNDIKQGDIIEVYTIDKIASKL